MDKPQFTDSELAVQRAKEAVHVDLQNLENGFNHLNEKIERSQQAIDPYLRKVRQSREFLKAHPETYFWSAMGVWSLWMMRVWRQSKAAPKEIH